MGDNLAELLERLDLATNNDSDAKIRSSLLSEVLNSVHENDLSSGIYLELTDERALTFIIKCLGSDQPEVQAKAAEVIAEVAKATSCRGKCTAKEAVSPLVLRLSSSDDTVALQACRALGNICYENDDGRELVNAEGGTQQLLKLLRRATTDQTTDESESKHQLRLVATGFLLNLLNSSETLVQDQIMEVMNVLSVYLSKFSTQDDIITHVLLSLTCLVDTDVDQEFKTFKGLTPILKKILQENYCSEVTEACLELLNNIAINDDMKTTLAHAGICEALLEVVNRTSNENDETLKAIVKSSADLVVLILVGDESMPFLYGNGTGYMYLEITKWMNSPKEYLQIASALAIGNFARNDAHCIQMVESGLGEKLLVQLSGNDAADGDIRVQHAVLSALRNLAIAAANKVTLLREGALCILVAMAMEVQAFPVVFKLLATLRMLVDGQWDAAISLGGNVPLLSRVSHWCETPDHPGVQGEASRLLAWVVKNGGGEEGVAKGVLEGGCVIPLVQMLGSEHSIMVCESTLALTVLLHSSVALEMIPMLTQCHPDLKLALVLQNTSLPAEILMNALTLVKTLLSRDETRHLLATKDLSLAIDPLLKHENEETQHLAQCVHDLLQK